VDLPPAIGPFGGREWNAAACAVALRDHGPATVADLAGRTGLSRPTVEAGLDAMVRRGMVSALAQLTSGGRGMGRPARVYEYRPTAAYVAAVDVGAHRVKVLVSDLAGGIAAWRDEPTGAGAVGPERMAAVTRVINRCLADARVPISDLAAMGIAVTGMVGPNGRLIVSRNLPDWEGVDVVERLRREYGCPVGMENDIRMAALAEHRLGAARLADDVVYLFAGHRVSMGLILGGTLRRGHHSAAGEMGGIAFSTSVDSERDQLKWSSAGSGEEVFHLAAEGDPAARDEVARFAAGLARGVAIVAMAIDPDLIVVGGGLSRAGGILLDPLRDAVNREIPVPANPTIVASEFGAESVALGALVHAFGVGSASLYGVAGVPEPTVDVTGLRTLTRGTAA
jgi:predicted NBD/HSP70 family sugar kinase